MTADSEPGDSSIFTQLTPDRASSKIIDQIIHLMRTRQLRAGDRLPPERELCQLVGAARGTMREALRVLESRGLLEIRVGAKGGAFVTTPSSRRAAQGVVDLLVSERLSVEQVGEVRSVLEVGVLPLICQRVTSTDTADLRQLCARDRAALASGSYAVTYSMDFHLRLIAAAHNPAFDMLAEAMRAAVQAALDAKSEPESPNIEGERELGVDDHERLIDLIEAGEVDEAVALMLSHLHRTAGWWSTSPA